MKKFIQLIVIFFIIIGCSKNNNEIKDTEKQDILAFVKNEVTAKNLNSVSFAVIKNGALLWSDAVGFADKANNIKATSQTLYLIASVSKTVTGVALMQLQEKGLFQLNDDINTFLPFSIRNPSFPNEPITFKMLCNHTSSISDENYFNYNFYSFGTDSSLSLTTMMSQFFTTGGNYFSTTNFTNNKPGTTVEYTNMGIALMGYLVERISQKPFYQYCNENIFVPLGMSKTSWRLTQFPFSELAIPYSEPASATNLLNPHYTFSDYPNGGLRTNVNDLAKFFNVIIKNGTYQGVTILNPTTVSLIKQKSGFTDSVSEYGLVFRYFNVDGLELFGHTGGESGVNSGMLADLSKNTGIIIFSNSTPQNGKELEPILKRLLMFASSK